MATEDVTLSVFSERAKAFLALLRVVEAELIGFVRRRVPSRQVVEDIVQNTYLRAWRHTKFDPTRGDAKACLFKIATNLIRDCSRCSDNHQLWLEEQSASGYGSASKASLASLLIDQQQDDPLVQLIASERAETVRKALPSISGPSTVMRSNGSTCVRRAPSSRSPRR